MNPFKNCLADKVLRVDDFLGFRKYFQGDFFGNHNDTVFVTDHEISAGHRDFSNLDWLPVRDELPPAH